MLLVSCRNNTVVIIMPTQNIELTKLKLYNNIYCNVMINVTTSNNYAVTCSVTKFVNISGTILTISRCHL